MAIALKARLWWQSSLSRPDPRWFSRDTVGSDLTLVPATSPGEGCIALRLEATETELPIYTPLTHHGEMTGHFRGEIKLQTSQGKMREKLYGKQAPPPPPSQRRGVRDSSSVPLGKAVECPA